MNRIVISLTVGLFFSLSAMSQLVKHNNIRFDFRVEKLIEFKTPDKKEIITIYGTLFNPNTDTVYFLSISCDGMQYLLQYDSTNFLLYPFLLCNASWPIIEKIPPDGKLDFTAHFKNINKDNEIKLGFYLYEVERSFDIDDPKLNVYELTRKHKNIIWSNLHRFE